MSMVPSGGPSTINGVLYQMLWTLLRTMELHASDCLTDGGSGQIIATTLVIEPRGGGGDLQEVGESTRTVQQVKAKSGGGTWSLREIVEGVLTDLYLAVDLERPNTSYSFITEGRIDGWRHVYDSFFQSIGSRTLIVDDIRSCLDDSKPLQIGPKKRRSSRMRAGEDRFWSDAEYTELQLFDQIVVEIRKKKSVSDTEADELTRQKVWHLLSKFAVLEKQTPQKLQRQINRRLEELVDYIEDLDKVRDSLLMSLAHLGAKGSAEIDNAREFLATQGLRSKPFSDWPDLRQLSHAMLERDLERFGYKPVEDVRLGRARVNAAEWPLEKPLLLLSGGSGQGKSWSVYALSRELMSEPGLIVLVEGTRGVESALRDAARLVWQRIKGNDQELSLALISRRLRMHFPDRATRWLTLLIDGLRDPSDAHELAKLPWRDLGIRLVVSCEPDIADSIMRVMPGLYAALVLVVDFTLEELQTYLSISIGTDWPDIPGDVRDTLRRPLLARLYRDVAASKPWKEPNEYALYSRFWARLVEDERARRPLDRVGLERLALSLLDNAPYPWTARQVEESRVDNAGIESLVRAGWLRRTPGDYFEVCHDRLLNWAVATSLVNAIKAEAFDQETFCMHLAETFRGDRRFQGRRLDYVPKDVLWLLTRTTGVMDQILDAVVLALERVGYHQRETLYKQVLPALGTSVLTALFRRLTDVASTDDVIHQALIIEAITTIDSPDIASLSIQLLGNESRFVQRAAMRILSKRPSAAALDRIWNIHVQMEIDPTAFLRAGEQEWYLYKESFGALRSCAKLDPGWIERVIERAETTSEPWPVYELAYLLGNIKNGRDIWRRSKLRLIRLVPPLHSRSIVVNIFAHNDSDEIPWLIDRVPSETNGTGPWALKALAKLAPDVAVEQLPRLSVLELSPTRHWYVPELLAKRPEATRAQLFCMMRAAEDPWAIAFVFQDDEDSLDDRMLDLLLTDFEKRLDTDLSMPTPERSRPVFKPLLLLSRINRIGLLKVFQGAQETRLEEKLTDWLLREGPLTGVWARPLHDKAVNILYKIGGVGFTKVVNAYLKANTRWGRLKGLELAFKRPNAETLDLLRTISEQEEL
jgi:hypothetical protein